MTPPHVSDYEDTPPRANRPNGDRTPVMSPAEISQVTEAGRVLVDMIMPAVRDELARHTTAQREKAAETSAALGKLPKTIRTWQAIAAALLSLTIGSAGAFAGVTITVDKVEKRQGVSEQAAAQAAAEASAAASYLAAPRTEPADVGRLADTLDRLDRRLEGLEARLERLEDRRGR